MSSSSESDPAAMPGVTGGGEVRTYRGRTVEELVPQIRAELGEGAIILRERQGLSGGVGGFFAQKCVEIQAQAGPRVSIVAGDDLDEGFDLADIDEDAELDEAEFEAAATPTRAALPVGLAAAAELPEVRAFAGALQAAATATATAPAPVAAPVPGTFETAPAPFEERSQNVPDSGNFRDRAPAQAGAVSDVPAVPAPRPSFRAQPVAPPAPAFEPVEIPVPVAVQPVDASAAPSGPFRVARATPAPAARELRPNLLATRLTDRGMTPAFAEALTDGIDDVSDLTDHLVAILPAAVPLPFAGGAVAVVGSGGTGKTRVVAALAAAAARAGHHVSVARLGTPERQLELAELLRDEPVDVLPAMRTRATARAVASAREQGLVIVDTTSASPSDRSAMEVLAETLGAFAFDAVLLTVPATFTPQAADRLADGFAALPLTGLVATHADESSDLGAVAELSIRHQLAVGHVHSGLDVACAIETFEPVRLAGELI